MVTKMLKISMGLVLLVLLNACPGVDCGDSLDAHPTGLIKIEPLQSSYQLGDEITYHITLPSTNDFFGRTLDLYNETGVLTTMLATSEIHRLLPNEIEVIDGEHRQIDNSLTAHLKYYQVENEYRYRIRVKFTHVGSYSLFVAPQIHFQRKTDKECFTYVIRTTIEGVSTNFFEFDVVQ